MGIDLGNLAALRTFRVLRALKTVAIIPGKYSFLLSLIGLIQKFYFKELINNTCLKKLIICYTDAVTKSCHLTLFYPVKVL